MSLLERVGVDARSDRSLFVLDAPCPADVPSELDVDGQFVCLLAWDATTVPGAEVSTLADRLLQAGCVYICAWGPALWLLYSVNLDYHRAVMCLCGALVVAGSIGLFTVATLLPGGGRLRITAHLASFAIAGLVFAQGGWLLRPFLVRPRAEVTFLRPMEANVFSSVGAAWRSSRGDYRGWDAEAVQVWSDGDDVRDPSLPGDRSDER